MWIDRLIEMKTAQHTMINTEIREIFLGITHTTRLPNGALNFARILTQITSALTYKKTKCRGLLKVLHVVMHVASLCMQVVMLPHISRHVLIISMFVCAREFSGKTHTVV